MLDDIRREFQAGLLAFDRREQEYRELLRGCYESGYCPSHCIHGTYLWRDYDVICGACESGPETRTEYAMARVRRYRAIERKAVFGAIAHAITQIATSGESETFKCICVDEFLRAMSETWR